MSRLAAAVALAALAAAAVVGPGASAQGGRTITFTELEKGATFKHVRNSKPKAPESNLLGDVIVFTNPIADASGKVVGKNHAVCATTVGARNFPKSVITCNGSVVLRDGTHDLAGRVQGRRRPRARARSPAAPAPTRTRAASSSPSRTARARTTRSPWRADR